MCVFNQFTKSLRYLIQCHLGTSLMRTLRHFWFKLCFSILPHLSFSWVADTVKFNLMCSYSRGKCMYHFGMWHCYVLMLLLPRIAPIFIWSRRMMPSFQGIVQFPLAIIPAPKRETLGDWQPMFWVYSCYSSPLVTRRQKVSLHPFDEGYNI